MSAEYDWEPLLSAALGHALAYRRSLATRPAAARESAEQVMARLDGLRTLPEASCAPKQVLQELVEHAEPGLSAMPGPRFFGWVIGGTLPAALSADWLTSAWDQNAGTGEGAPAAMAFEAAALGWVRQVLRLPEETCGALVTGGMTANLVGLASARSQVLQACDWDVEHQGLTGAPAVRVIVAHERHDTIDKAVRILGLGKLSMLCVGTDGQGRLVPADLKKALRKTTGPVIVCAQSGNVNSGAFDPLEPIADLLDEYRAQHGPELAWLHVDGAIGLWARASSAFAHHVAGLERADSWATDGHKLLNVPYDCGIALSRHPRAQRRAMGISAAYLSSGQESGFASPGFFALELSRRARGFALWAALRQLGTSGVDALVVQLVANARRFAAEFAEHAELQVLNDVVFNQVVLHAAAPEGTSEADWTTQLTQAIQKEGTCYPTPTVWRGRPALRFAISNASTEAADIVASANAVKRVVATLRGG